MLGRYERDNEVVRRSIQTLDAFLGVVAQVDVKLRDEETCQILLDRGEGPFVQVLHMIPEALTAQCSSTQREDPAENGAAVPGGEFAFAGGCNSPFDRRQEDILADRRSLNPLRRVAVNRSDDVELLRDVPQSRCGTEVPFLGIQWAAWGLREEFEELLSGAEVAEDPDARAALGVAIRFDDTPVAVAADCVGLEAGHDSYIPHAVPLVNRAVICSGMRQQPRHHRSQRACSGRLGFSFEVHMISIYNRPGIGTEEKRGRAACLGFGQSRAVAAFGGVRAELMERELRHVGRSNENVTRKLGLGSVPNQTVAITRPLLRAPAGACSSTFHAPLLLLPTFGVPPTPFSGPLAVPAPSR